MNQLPSELYDAAGCRNLDATAIQGGVPGFTLMRRAGDYAFAILNRVWPEPCRVDVVCGSGNNGGDGYIIAARAKDHGYRVRLFATSSPRSDDARQARVMAEEVGLNCLAEADFDGEADVIVDALLGTGLERAPDGPAAQLIKAINQSGAEVLSVDIPSGLNTDTGVAPGLAVLASATVTFIGAKPGLFTGHGPDHCGEVFYNDLGVDRDVFDHVDPVAHLVQVDQMQQWLPRRRRCGHKGNHGHVLLIGGNYGMVGALRLASEAAARGGAGLVTAITRAGHEGLVNRGQPEIMAHNGEQGIPGNLPTEGCVIAIGPGLGQDAWADCMMQSVMDCDVDRVIDADGLNWLASYSGSCRGRLILTPHPGEAARLLNTTVGAVQADRLDSVRAIAERYQAVCVLKGCGTLISDGDVVWCCPNGNPGMGTGGMGDCLTGLIAALLGQGLTPLKAAICGVWLHASAADRQARKHGMIGLLASDLFDDIRHLLNGIDESI